MSRRHGAGDTHHDPHRTLDLGTDPVMHHRHHTVVHRVVVDERPVVVKRGRGRARIALRAEAEVLAHLPDDIAVSFVSIRETDDHTDLVLDDAGRCDLGAPGQLSQRTLRQSLADTVRLVGRLHDSEWVHGALCAEHVVLGPDHRPKLCSVGSSRRATPRDVDEEQRQLVSLVAGALLRHADSDRPARERRASRSLAERVRRSADPSTSVDTDTLADLLEPSHEVGDRSRRPVMPQLPLGAVAATVALCGLTAVLVTSSGPADLLPDAPVDLLTTPTHTVPPDPADGTTPRRVAGHVVERDGVQYAVGAAGDRVVLGDWECSGSVTPALLRPRTGEVHLFDEWAGPGAPVRARLLAIRPGASDLLVDRDICDRLKVRNDDGSIVDIPTVDPTMTPNKEDDQ